MHLGIGFFYYKTTELNNIITWLKEPLENKEAKNTPTFKHPHIVYAQIELINILDCTKRKRNK